MEVYKGPTTSLWFKHFVISSHEGAPCSSDGLWDCGGYGGTVQVNPGALCC